jgi:hypothetical protein
MKAASKPRPPSSSLVICALIGMAILGFQLKGSIQRGKLKSTGQVEAGYLVGATRHRLAFIPMGYSLQVAYAGTTKDFDVSREVFYRYVDADGRYRSYTKIDVQYLPLKRGVAEMPEMMGVYVWWLGGPLLGYGFGAGLLLTLIGMRNLARR